MPTVLVVDDEPDLLVAQLRHRFGSRSLTIAVAVTGAEGLARAAELRPEVILLDVALPDATGLEVFQQLRLRDARVPVIFVTGSTTADTAIEAMKLGALDYLFKPVDLEQLEKIVSAALELSRRMHEPAVIREAVPDEPTGDAIIGRCAAMREVYKEIGRVAAQSVLVLITGESGTGKELVARAIYQHSPRADRPFLAINCAAIPEQLLESELFGHEKGAFTGADRRRIGKFEQCHGGTLLLDEIGDMPAGVQAKVLRLLQEQTFERVGGNETIRTDVRLIAATNQNLDARAREGKFRWDLYYRLSVFTIRLPPLRERVDDLPLLVEYYRRRANAELHKDVREITPEAWQRLAAHSWPGNVRELQSVLKQAILRAAGPILTVGCLPESLGLSAETPSGGETLDALRAYIQQRLTAGSQHLYEEVHQLLDRTLLPMVLEHVGGSQVQGAEVLGIARKTLRLKLRELGLTVVRTIDREEEDET